MKKRYWIFLLISISFQKAIAQCTNSVFQSEFGFGTGANHYGNPDGLVQNYTFVTRSPNEGEYTLVHNTNGTNPIWYQTIRYDLDHSENDNSYIMVVNAKAQPGIFYEKNITGFCPNSKYQLSPGFINLVQNIQASKPNLRFVIEADNGTILSDYTTGDILDGLPWKTADITFTTPSNFNYLTLKVSTVNSGGIGNDFALKSFNFYRCIPDKAELLVDGNNANQPIENCVATVVRYNLTSVIPAGYANKVYQWQKKDGANWIDIVGEENDHTTIDLTNFPAGSYTYRLLIGMGPTHPSAPCALSSKEVTVILKEGPVAAARNNGPLCEGGDLQLSSNGGTKYEWTGPNGYFSNEQNPIIKNISLTHAGIYKVKVTGANPCFTNDQTEVLVLPKIIGSVNPVTSNICEGSESAVQLVASGGTSYQWSPVVGLSDPNISNPIASPEITTTYTVKISNGSCSIDKMVKVSVTQIPSVDAGPNRTMLLGQKITLNASANGADLKYYWTPSDYLDDPMKLNPIASPPTNIIYTLNVSSSCGTVSDVVSVKVYPKIEIPNTFTPNGDGINDTWSIPSIDAFPKTKLTVVNRLGQVLFEGSKDIQWDGKHNGKDVPMGSYYYTLSLSENDKIYTGWVMLVR